jgi:uncharacterized membrane protein (DUF441 family)
MERMHKVITKYGLLAGLALLAIGILGAAKGGNVHMGDVAMSQSVSLAGLALVIAGRR